MTRNLLKDFRCVRTAGFSLRASHWQNSQTEKEVSPAEFGWWSVSQNWTKPPHFGKQLAVKFLSGNPGTVAMLHCIITTNHLLVMPKEFQVQYCKYIRYIWRIRVQYLRPTSFPGSFAKRWKSLGTRLIYSSYSTKSHTLIVPASMWP